MVWKTPLAEPDTTQIEVDSLPYRSKQGKESLCETCSASLYCILCRHSIIHCEPVALCRTCYTSPMHCNSWSSPFWSMRWSRWADDQQVTKHLDHMLFLGWAAPPDSGVSCPPDPHPIGQITVRLFSWPLLLCWDNTYSRCKICSSKMLETRGWHPRVWREGNYWNKAIISVQIPLSYLKKELQWCEKCCQIEICYVAVNL